MIREIMLGVAAACDKGRRAHIVGLVHAYLDSLGTGDIDGRMALFAAGAVFEDPIGSTPVVGRDALRAYFSQSAGLSVKATSDFVAVSGDEAAYLFTARLANGPDDSVTIRVIETIHVDADGRIDRMRACFDIEGVS